MRTETANGRDRRATPSTSTPSWIQNPVRAVALLVVVPLRLLWELTGAVTRFLHRFLLTPVASFLTRYVVRPLRWLLVRLIWPPVRWLFVHLVWRPLVWLYRHLVAAPLQWLARLLTPPLRVLRRGLLVLLAWIVRRLAWIAPGVRAVGRVLWAAVTWAWRIGGAVAVVVYRALLHPIWLALRWVWRHLFAPAVRWSREVVWRPVAAATREVLAALGLRS